MIGAFDMMVMMKVRQKKAGSHHIINDFSGSGTWYFTSYSSMVSYNAPILSRLLQHTKTATVSTWQYQRKSQVCGIFGIYIRRISRRVSASRDSLMRAKITLKGVISRNPTESDSESSDANNRIQTHSDRFLMNFFCRICRTP